MVVLFSTGDMEMKLSQTLGLNPNPGPNIAVSQTVALTLLEVIVKKAASPVSNMTNERKCLLHYIPIWVVWS